MRGAVKFVVVAVLAVLAAACGGSARPSTTAIGTHQASAAGGSDQASSTGNAAASLEQQYVTVINRVSPEVVQVTNPRGLGSGVVFDTNGDVVTNAHVVAGGGPYQVTDSSGHNYAASVVGQFVPDDLAVVHAKGASWKAASFANSRELQVGDIVLALGNPLGLRSSVTNGIVSALGRTVGEPTGAVLPDAIQTSAPINPGNSGGALVDLQGQVVGIPTLAATDPELGGSAAPGIGFAIPSSLVTSIASQIVQHGHVVDSGRAFLGVELGTGAAGGAVVAAVQAGGPAAKAGIAPGDVIVAIAGQPTAAASDVSAALATLKPGQTVPVQIIRPDGSKATVEVKLGQYPGNAS